ncbi:nucleoside transporter C-terminal domain-containing protein, partial [Bacillus altitudinis]|uniref:nucleoside transporter C-terminal domain-containing protein n=1 Tax=Bacillus altitudinis TaxID=293387 RepID=UPI002355CF63
MKVAIVVGGMLIGLVALIGMINGILRGGMGVCFEDVVGYVFVGFGLVVGVRWSEGVEAGSIMGRKMVCKEFVGVLAV